MIGNCIVAGCSNYNQSPVQKQRTKWAISWNMGTNILYSLKYNVSYINKQLIVKMAEKDDNNKHRIHLINPINLSGIIKAIKNVWN